MNRVTPAHLPLFQELLRSRIYRCAVRMAVPGTLPPKRPAGCKLLARGKFGSPSLKYAYWQFPGRKRYRLFWSDAGTFDLDGKTRSILIFPEENASTDAIEEVLRGPAISFLLLEQGFEPLHASAVTAQSRCLALAGGSGAGKSSLCAYLQQQGWRFFSDDLLPLRRARRGVLAYPGLPHLRLTEKTTKALGIRRGQRRSEKLTLTQHMKHHQPVPLAGVFVLRRQEGTRGEVRLQRLMPGTAFKMLVALSRNQAQTAQWRMENQLRTLGWVSTHVPVYLLRYPSRFAAWEEIRGLLAEGWYPPKKESPSTQEGAC